MAQLNSLIVTGDSRFLNTINGNITSANGIHRATMESTSTSTAFVLTADGIDSLYDGLIITCKNIKVASATNCTIDLNGLGAKRIWLSQNNGYCTTHWGLNQTYFFIYDEANSRWELQQGRDTDGNDISTLHSYYSRPIVDTNGIKQYSLFAYTKNIKVASFTTNNGTGTKTFNTTDYFDIRKIFYYNGSGNVAANAKIGNNTMSLNENLVDMRYTFNGVTTNASTSSLVAEKPVYICFNMEDYLQGGRARIVEPYFTQEPSVGAYILYVLIGYMNDSYRCSLLMDNQTYIYNYGEGAMRPYPIAYASAFAADANAVNGHTVAKDVPSNAVFTDHTYSGTGLISVNSSGVISTTAEANQNAFSNVKVGSTTVAADSKTDTLELVGSNVTLTPDATNDKVTIGITKSNVTTALGYTPPTANNNVTQTADDSTDSYFEVLFSNTADNTTRTEASRKSSKLKFNPSTGDFRATALNSYVKIDKMREVTGHTGDTSVTLTSHAEKASLANNVMIIPMAYSTDGTVVPLTSYSASVSGTTLSIVLNFPPLTSTTYFTAQLTYQL